MKESFHEDVYQFIFSLFESEEIKKKMEAVFNDLGSRFWCSKAAEKYHQNYEGGLADHCALVALDAYHSALTKPWLKLKKDDVLVVALLHDIDKIGFRYNAPYGEPVARNDREVVTYLEKFGLRSNETQDGVILIHGGWVPKELNGVEHPPIAITGHSADMLGSHATKTINDTRRIIGEIMVEILKIHRRVMRDEQPKMVATRNQDPLSKLR